MFLPRRLVALSVAAGVAVVAAVRTGRAQQPVAASAGAYDPRLFEALEWRNIGPNRGGRSVTAAGSASRPLEYYFGATGGGVWKTTDGGITWRPVSDQHFHSSSVGALAVCAANPDVVYAGMGETQLRSTVMQGDGVYKTSDGGKTWTHLGLAETQAISRVRIDPADCNLVYVAALGHPYGPNPERGVFRSRDGGRTWEKVLFRNERTGASDLVLDPNDPRTLYAGMWEVYRTPWALFSGGPGSGLFKSVDGGDAWTEITRNPGLPRGVLANVGVAVSGADSRRLYAIVEADSGGIFRSSDAGATWERINGDLSLWERGYYYTRIYADPKDRETIYVVNIDFSRSTDGGKSFKAIRAPHSDYHDLWIAPTDPKRMILSQDGGAVVSTNAGETWTGMAYPTAQLYHVITSRHRPYHVCGAQQDNTTICVSSVPAGRVGAVFYSVAGGEAGYIAAHPLNPDVFYAGNYDGFLTRYDRATGQSRNIQVWPEKTMGGTLPELTERFQWTSPTVISPLDPSVLYAASQHLWRTSNEGQSWQRASPDLTRHDPKTLAPAAAPVRQDRTGADTYGTIFTVAPSAREAGTIWVGSDDGLVHLTRDGGASWQKVTPPDLPEFSRISLIEASPHRPGTAYVAANRYQLDDRAPYFFRTDDYGRSWTRIVDGIPAGHFARAIREDPQRAGLLYAGTEHGVSISFDDGGHWQSLSLNLPDVQVADLVVEQDDLVIATYGRSFYVLDGIAPLRQLSPEVAGARLHLFQPTAPVRVLDQKATVYYALKAAPASLEIAFLDSAGTVIRKFTNAEKSAPAADGDDPPGRAAAPGRVPAKAGLNRFTWNLQYPGFTSFPGIILWYIPTEGPVALPGKYRVRLTADGETQTRELEIRPDPRLREVSPADLRQRFELALRIRDQVSEATRAVIAIRALQRQVQDRVKHTARGDLGSAGAALLAQLSGVEGELYQVENRTVEDSKNHPMKLVNQIGYLLSVVESAEARPTDQTRAVFDLLSTRLAEQLRRLDRVSRTELARFNDLLRRNRLQPVEAEPKPKEGATP